jgi:hypothetical protein
MLKQTMLAVVLLVGCSRVATDDTARLEQARSQYGDRYNISLSSDGLYVDAKQKQVGSVSEQDIHHMYALLAFEEGTNSLRRGKFIYLNVYDASNKPLWQVWWKDGNFHTNQVRYY